jgi:hypothetical protein
MPLGRHTLGVPLATLLLILVSGCGGGGSATTGTGDSSSSGVPASRPAFPSSIYSGSRSAAALDGVSAATVANDMFLAAWIAENAEQVPPQNGMGGNAAVIDVTSPGPEGGTVEIKGRIAGPDSGWLQETFKDYTFSDGNTSNGSALIERSYGTKAQTTTYGWSGYHVTATGIDIQLDGMETDTANLANGDETSDVITMNLSAKDALHGSDVEFANLKMTNILGAAFPQTTFSGRVYTQGLGYTDLTTKGTLLFRPSFTRYYPVYGDDLVLTGAGTAAFHISPLNNYFFSVGLDPSGGGTVTQGTRLTWSNVVSDMTATASHGPVAVAKQTETSDTLFETGSPVTVNGRFSHSSDGGLLSFAWTLRQAPPGSTAKLSGSTTATTATFTPDVAGDYLLELDVTEGTATARNVTVVTAATPTELMYGTLGGTGGYKMEPVASGTVGTSVQLDGRDTTLSPIPGGGAFDDNDATPTYFWSLSGPQGSHAVLSGSSSATPSFVPDVPGYYTVSVSANMQFGPTDFGVDIEVISVGQDLKLDPGIKLSARDVRADPYAVVDLDGDGKPDIVEAFTGGVDVTPGLYVYHNAGSGQFTQTTFSAFTTTPDSIAVGDLNGDGRPDIAMTFGTSVEVWLQNSDGSFASPVTLNYSLSCGDSVAGAAITRLNTSGGNSLVVRGCNGLEVWNYSSGFGSAANVPLIPSPGNMHNILYADLTGDGNIDAVGYGQSGSTLGIYLAAGNGSGGMGTPGLATTAGQDFTVTDVDGDGHVDLCVTSLDGSVIDVYPGSSTGLASSPVSHALAVNAASVQPFVADINGDGRQDLLIPGLDLGILEQQSGGGFSPEVFYPILGQPVMVDLNGDGVLDVVTFSDGLMVYLGHP